MGRRIMSIALWGVYALVTLAFLPIVTVVFLATAPFDRGRYAAGRWFRRAAMGCVKLNPLWDFRVSGVMVEDPRRPYVAVANHESFADIFLISHLPWEMKWLSKQAIFRIPVMGWMMHMAGDISVKRGRAHSRARAMEAIKDRLGRKVSVMIMPEGTRSRSGEMLPFQTGAFRVAVETGCPILPIVVAGTRDCIPADSMLFGRARAEVRVLPPVETAGLTRDDVPELRDRVRRMIVDARQELGRELRTRASWPVRTPP